LDDTPGRSVPCMDTGQGLNSAHEPGCSWLTSGNEFCESL
jgi:hypothetical protein